MPQTDQKTKEGQSLKNNILENQLSFTYDGKGITPEIEKKGAKQIKEIAKNRCLKSSSPSTSVFRNAKKLLLTYLRAKRCAEERLNKNILQLMGGKKTNMQAILEAIKEACPDSDPHFRSEIRSIDRTAQFLKLIDDSLKKIITMSVNGAECYQILTYLYCDGKVDKEYPDLAAKMRSYYENTENNITRATFYRRYNEGIELISTVLWSEPSQEVGLWMDLTFTQHHMKTAVSQFSDGRSRRKTDWSYNNKNEEVRFFLQDGKLMADVPEIPEKSQS